MIRSFYALFTIIWIVILAIILITQKEMAQYMLFIYTFGAGIAIYMLSAIILLVNRTLKDFKNNEKPYWKLTLIAILVSLIASTIIYLNLY